MKFDRIFLKFEKLPSNYITKLSTYTRHKYEVWKFWSHANDLVLMTWHRSSVTEPTVALPGMATGALDETTPNISLQFMKYSNMEFPLNL